MDCVRAQPAVTARTVAGAPWAPAARLVTQALLGLLVVVWLGQLVLPGLTGALGFVPSLSRRSRGASSPWASCTPRACRCT